MINFRFYLNNISLSMMFTIHSINNTIVCVNNVIVCQLNTLFSLNLNRVRLFNTILYRDIFKLKHDQFGTAIRR